MFLKRIKLIARLCASLALLASLAPSLASAGQPPVRDDVTPTAGAAVATDHHAATEAAWEILRRGGTAIDAATAAAFVLSVVTPEAASLAGGGAALHYQADGGHITAYIGREISSAAARPEWLDRKVRDGAIKLRGGRSVGAPTFMQMIGKMRAAGGRLPWDELTVSAERIARTGVRLSDRSARALAEVVLPLHGGGDKIFGAGGSSAQAGAHIRNPELAEVLAAIGTDGPRVLMGGVIGREMVDAIRTASRMPAELTLEEISAADAVIAPPLCVAYRQSALCAPPQPTLGPSALQAIALFDRALPAQLTPLAWGHTLALAHRLAMSDARRFLADPATFPDLMSPLLKPRALARRAKRLDPERDRGIAGSSRQRGIPRGLDGARPSFARKYSSSVIVIDGNGDAVALSMTLTMPYGSGLAVRGVLLNAANTAFEPTSRRQRFYVANQLGPGKRPRLDLAPIMALDKDRQLILVAASAGGRDAPAYLAKAVTLSLALGKPVDDAIAAPNIASNAKTTRLEARTAAERLGEPLTDIGHFPKLKRMASGLLLIRRGAGTIEAAADPRGYGSAISRPPAPAPEPVAADPEADPSAAARLDSPKRGS